MFVNKYTVSLDEISGSTLQLPIPVMQSHDVVGQTDLLKTEFVAVEREKAINPIVDYEKVRFIPANIHNVIMKTITYKLHFYNTTYSAFNNHTWESIGFTYEDLYYRKNRFKKSFLQLVFYDSKNLLAQNPIFIVTLFPQITPYSTVSSTDYISFVRQNPITNPKGFAEGFYQYFYKDLVEEGTDYELYMRATFFNAGTGVGKPLMMYSTVPAYDSTFTDKIHLKFTFRKTNENYLYIVDDTSVVTYDLLAKKIEINLYESIVL